MSDRDTPPLPPDAAAALDADRRHPDPPDAVRAAVLARVRRSVGLPPLPGGGGGGAAAGGGTVVALKAAAGVSKTVVAALASVAAAAAVVTVVVAQRPAPAAPRPPSAPIARAVAPARRVVTAPSVVEARPSPAVEPAPIAVAVATAPRHLDASAPRDDLSDERAQLDDVRAAMRGERYGEAERALRRYRERFPRPRLAEERDFLAVRLLTARGDEAGAARRRERFRRRYPSSIYLDGLDAPAQTISP
ncbi:MAG: hypothetical protein R3A52_09095 [Polyangiales bacterium]